MIIRFKYNGVTDVLIRVKGGLKTANSIKCLFYPLYLLSFGNSHDLAKNW
jgi:hypothetical protein